MSVYSPDDGTMARLEHELSRPATTTRRNGSRIGAEGTTLAPETHSPPLAGDIRDRDGTFAGVRREADASPSRAFPPLTCRGLSRSRPFYFFLHRRVSQTNHPYPDKCEIGGDSFACLKKSFARMQTA